MTLNHGFRHLADVLETLESNGLDVLDVAAADERTDRLILSDVILRIWLRAEERFPRIIDGKTFPRLK